MDGSRPEIIDTINYGIGTENDLKEQIDTYGSSITDGSCPIETGRKLIDNNGD